MMTILVTGAFGYVGGRLIRALPALGLGSVLAASRRPQTAVPDGVRPVAIDWADRSGLEDLCRGVDVVVHLAGMPEQDCARDPERAVSDNIVNTLRLVDAAERAGVRRLIAVSTAKVFGANWAGCMTEECRPVPVSPYAMTHRAAEDYVLARQALGKLEGVVVRLSNTVGAPAGAETDAWTVIGNDLCRQAATAGRVVLKSSGLAWRNFVAMADVIGALAHLATVPRAALGSGLFHLGGASSLRILDLAEMVAAEAGRIIGAPVAVERPDPAPGETHPPLEWSIGKLVATGWRPDGDLRREIADTIHLCRASGAAVPSSR